MSEIDKVESVAKRLYMAYFTSAGGLSISVPGRELGTWDQMPEDVRYVWRSVARCAIRISESGTY